MHSFSWGKLVSDEYDGSDVPVILTDRLQTVIVGLLVDLFNHKATYFTDYDDYDIVISDFIDNGILRVLKQVDVFRVGMAIIDYATSFDDEGGKWMVCDGDSLLRADYPELFAKIGTQYGAVDGTHFNIPDMRGRVPVGEGYKDGNTGNPLFQQGTKTGEFDHTLTIDEMPEHTHNAPVSAALSGAVGNTAVYGSGIYLEPRLATQLTGGNDPHNNIQPSIGARWIIRVKP